MVFGHYSFPIKTLNNYELPPQLQQVERGVVFELTLRVVHVLFIPFFPFEKTWTMSKDGKKYKVNPEIGNMLDRYSGRKGTPWYAFAGPIILIVGFIYYNISSTATKKNREMQYAAAKEKKVNGNLEKIKFPTTNDYYTISNNYKKCGLKVNSYTEDSVIFLVPTQDDYSKWYNDEWIVGYFKNPKALVRSEKVAKKDLEKIVNVNNSSSFKGYSINGFMGNNPIVLNEISRIERPVNYKYEDETAAIELKSIFNNFLSNTISIDSSWQRLDSSSVQYFKKILELAEKEDFQTIKLFIENNKYPLITYKYMLYTKFSFLEAMSDNKNEKKEDLLSEYAFYLKLIEQGLWLIDFDKKVIGKCKTHRVTFSNENKAEINIGAPSNMLTVSSNINFNVVFNKEDGQWKINLPSTFDYTKKQINKGIHGINRNGQFRKMVIDELKESDSPPEIPAEWNY